MILNLLFIISVLLAFLFYKKQNGYIICFTLLFFRIVTVLLHELTPFYKIVNSILLFLFYIICICIQYKGWSLRNIYLYIKNPIVCSFLFVTTLMFFYNIIGPYYLQYNEIINQKQSSFVINVLLPFLFAPIAEISTGQAAPTPIPRTIGNALENVRIPVTDNACNTPTVADAL